MVAAFSSNSAFHVVTWFGRVVPRKALLHEASHCAHRRLQPLGDLVLNDGVKRRMRSVVWGHFFLQPGGMTPRAVCESTIPAFTQIMMYSMNRTA